MSSVEMPRVVTGSINAFLKALCLSDEYGQYSRSEIMNFLRRFYVCESILRNFLFTLLKYSSLSFLLHLYQPLLPSPRNALGLCYFYLPFLKYCFLIVCSTATAPIFILATWDLGDLTLAFLVSNCSLRSPLVLSVMVFMFGWKLSSLSMDHKFCTKAPLCDPVSNSGKPCLLGIFNIQSIWQPS